MKFVFAPAFATFALSFERRVTRAETVRWNWIQTFGRTTVKAERASEEIRDRRFLFSNLVQARSIDWFTAADANCFWAVSCWQSEQFGSSSIVQTPAWCSAAMSERERERERDGAISPPLGRWRLRKRPSVRSLSCQTGREPLSAAIQ